MIFTFLSFSKSVTRVSNIREELRFLELHAVPFVKERWLSDPLPTYMRVITKHIVSSFNDFYF